MTGYTLPFEVFTFVPNFSNAPKYVSNKQVIWNFGDGTTSTNLTAIHSYVYPGTYPVTLTTFLSTGDSTVIPVVSSISLINLIQDQLLLTTNTNIQTGGQSNNPIYLERYNSYQTTVSGKNTVIKLSVANNASPFATSLQYYSNKNAQFLSISKFAIQTPLGLTVVDEVSTTNDTLYATATGTSVNLSLTPTGNSVVAGSSGCAVFYYIEDAQYGYVPPSITPSPSPPPSVTPSATPTPTPTPSVTSGYVYPSVTPTPSITPSKTPPVTPTPSITPSKTPTPSITPTVTPTPTATPSVSPSVAPSSTPSITPSPTPSPSSICFGYIISSNLPAVNYSPTNQVYQFYFSYIECGTNTSVIINNTYPAGTQIYICPADGSLQCYPGTTSAPIAGAFCAPGSYYPNPPVVTPVPPDYHHPVPPPEPY